MAINESVYGARENWYVPTQHSEQGETISAEVYYYNTIAEDDNLKIKVANYNTVSSPMTTIRSQMDGEYPSADFVIRNNWDASQTESIDPSIVQFGIGSQSGLANQEWWFVDWTGSGSQPSSTELPVLKNTDRYDVVNMAFAFKNGYVPTEFFSWGTGSILTSYDNGYLYQQQFRMQTWGNGNSRFDPYYSSSYGYRSGSYIQTQLVTQIPIKNLKVTPVIFAYKSDFSGYKKFKSISTYLSEKSTYPYLMCLKAQFRYRSGFNNSTDYDYNASFRAFILNKTSAIKGYNYTKNSDILTSDEVTYYNRIDRNIEDGITVAGRYGYGYGSNGSILGNEIYWTNHTESSTQFTVGEGDRVLQTPDFHFTLDNDNGLFYCDVSQMTNDQITEGIRKQLASFGLFFVDGISDINLALDDEKTFLGILENGVGYGKYSHGADNRNQPQWNWDTMEENDYDPENPPSPVMPDNWNDDANNPYSRLRLDLVNNWYILSELWLKTVFEKMTGIDLVTMDKNLTYGLNPIDCIIQTKRIYCNYNAISDYITTQQVTDISFGRLSLNIADSPSNNLVKTNSVMPVTYESIKSYPVGEPSSYRDFRSYMPFTTCAFYDAFCGIVEIDPAKILNKYITIYQTVDALSGDKITSLFASENPNNIGERVATLTGNCSEEIPINGLQAADYIRNKYLLSQQEDIALWNTVSRSAMGAGGASISGISGNVIGAATQAVGTIANTFIAGNQLGTIDYQLTHLTPQVSKVSKGTSNVESGVVFGPTLFLYLPKMNENYDELLYGNLTGFAGYKVVKPKDLSAGTHIFSHPKVSISGTKNEAYMLVDQLQKGIIIK